MTPQLLEFQQIFLKIEFELITLTSKAEEVFYNHPEKVVHVSIGYGVPGTGDIVSATPENGIHTLLLTKLY